MDEKPHGAPPVRPLTFDDLKFSLLQGVQDFRAAPILGLSFASLYVAVGLLIAWITFATGQTFWLVLAVLGFPLVGMLPALSFYETSRRLQSGDTVAFADVLKVVLAHRSGQLPALAAIIMIIFLFWFFLGHMIFALFLGLSPMTNISSSLEVFLTTDGLTMLGFGTLIGAAFTTLVFAMSVLGIPMLMDRDVDFMTATLHSIVSVRDSLPLYLLWGAFIAVVALASTVPLFLGLFITMPILGHARGIYTNG
jgi:uncharacterized membrane protein